MLSNHYPDIDLIIKLRHIPNVQNIQQLIEYEFEKIYSIVRNNFVRKPKLLIGNIAYENIMYIHNNNDCYVSTSHGESFGYSALEAIAFNNHIVCTSNTGYDDLLKNCGGFGIASEAKYCMDKDRIFPVYNSIYEKWTEPKIDDLVSKMSMCINEPKQTKLDRINKQNNNIQQYSYKNVAALLQNL